MGNNALHWGWRLTVLAAAALTACTGGVDTYPINAQAQQIGAPKIRYGLGIDNGPVTVRMPDGEMLKGIFRVTSDTGYPFEFANGQEAAALTVSGGNVRVFASGLDTEMLCAGYHGIFGHGSGKCQTQDGAVWGVDW